VKDTDKINLSHFQVLQWLQSVRYPYAHEGKNISKSKDWIGIPCPFCITPDHSYHCGINLYAKTIKCWRCGTKGTIIKLVMKLQRVNFNDAAMTITRFSRKSQLDTQVEHHNKKQFKLPLGTYDEILEPQRKYLIDRNFDPEFIQKKYGIKSIGPISTPGFANRILIPYFYGNQIVTYTSRDITNNNERERYRTCPEDIAIMNVDQLLYNIHTIRDIAVIVEGPTDVWRMGDNFAAMGSLVWNSERLILLKQCKQVFVWPDSGNREKNLWSILAHSIATIVPDVRFVELSEGDPGDLDTVTVRNFRREIFGRKY